MTLGSEPSFLACNTRKHVMVLTVDGRVRVYDVEAQAQLLETSCLPVLYKRDNSISRSMFG